MQQGGCIYLLTNDYHTVLYVGVTHDLSIRLYEHETGEYASSFTNRYNIHKLVYYEFHLRIDEAISREKEIKKWSRKKKERLISSENPDWADLSKEFE